MSEKLTVIVHLIQNLRNKRNPEENWEKLQSVIHDDEEGVISELSLRWLCSICDTYADYGSDIVRREALTISVFINMTRLAETTKFVRGNINEEKICIAKERQIPLYDGLLTFHVDNQDVFLNISKRMSRQMQRDSLMSKIWLEVLRRFHKYDSIISEFRNLSNRPERYFPLEPIGVEDNYGIAW